METVLITGGTGFIGEALTQLLTEHGYHVIVLSRQPHARTNSANNLLTYAYWDVRKQAIDLAAVQAADFIVHLAGANVAGHRWTNAYKKEIIDSRVQSSQLLFNTLQQHPNKVRKFISASGTGYYGENHNGLTPFTETDPPATDFLGNTCQAWEAGALQMEQLDKKVVIFRTGIALNKDGGALKEFYRTLHFGFESSPKTTAPRSNDTANSVPAGLHLIRRPSPLLYLPSLTLCRISRLKLRTPAFLPVTRFHNRMHRSPRPTLTISFRLGWTAKSFTPAGVAPGGAVSPLGWP